MELGRVPSPIEIKTSLARGFSEAFRVTFALKPLTSEEESLLNTKLPYFSSSEYIYKVRESLPRRKTLLFHPEGSRRIDPDICRHRYENPGHQPDSDYRRFLCYPKRTIFDLESLLKNSKASSSNIEEMIRAFFASRKPKIPGVTRVISFRRLKRRSERWTFFLTDSMKKRPIIFFPC